MPVNFKFVFTLYETFRPRQKFKLLWGQEMELVSHGSRDACKSVNALQYVCQTIPSADGGGTAKARVVQRPTLQTGWQSKTQSLF